MKTLVKILAALAATSLLGAASVHAAPVFKPANNEAGWTQQAQHPGKHKSRMEVRDETAHWRATHVGPGTNCKDGEKYCSNNHTGGMMNGGKPMVGRSGMTPADTYIGP